MRSVKWAFLGMAVGLMCSLQSLSAQKEEPILYNIRTLGWSTGPIGTSNGSYEYDGETLYAENGRTAFPVLNGEFSKVFTFRSLPQFTLYRKYINPKTQKESLSAAASVSVPRGITNLLIVFFPVVENERVTGHRTYVIEENSGEPLPKGAVKIFNLTNTELVVGLNKKKSKLPARGQTSHQAQEGDPVRLPLQVARKDGDKWKLEISSLLKATWEDSYYVFITRQNARLDFRKYVATGS